MIAFLIDVASNVFSNGKRFKQLKVYTIASKFPYCVTLNGLLNDLHYTHIAILIALAFHIHSVYTV